MAGYRVTTGSTRVKSKRLFSSISISPPLNGYRRLTYMMLDADVVACSAGTVYRVLSQAGLLKRNTKRSLKGTGFVQPLSAHAHWHIDISYLNIAGTFYFMASVLDGYSRSVVHWDIREKMEEVDIEIILQVAREKFPGVEPRIISDNGPQFIAKDFKHFVRLCGMKHVRTVPIIHRATVKSSGIIARIKAQCIRPLSPLSLDDAKRGVAEFVEEYNTVRLVRAIGHVDATSDLEGRQQAIFDERDRKLAEARQRRAESRASSENKKQLRIRTPSTASYTNSDAARIRALLGSNSAPHHCR